MMKPMEDSKCDKSKALAWAVSTKNVLQNVNGCSPNQLVFGMNVTLPSVLTGKPPALDSSCQSDVIRKKLAAIHSARQNFVKAESNERWKRAFRHQVRTYSDENYVVGDKVYYKRKSAKRLERTSQSSRKGRKFCSHKTWERFLSTSSCHKTKVNHTESSYEMGGNDSTTKFSTAVTKRKTNTKQVPMLNSMFEVDISDNERDNKHTQRNRMSQLRQIQKFGTIKSPWRSKMRLTILVQCRYLKKQSIQGMKTQQKGISKKNLQKSSCS